MFSSEVVKVFKWSELEGKTLHIILARETKEGPYIIAGYDIGSDIIYVLELKES